MKMTRYNNYARKYLVGECQKIHIDLIVQAARKNIIPQLESGSAEIDGTRIAFTSKPLHHGGKRLWLLCPLCGLMVGVIYKHPVSGLVGCRHCLNLEYRCRVRKGMVENSLE
jgi:hypothetical protein